MSYQRNTALYFCVIFTALFLSAPARAIYVSFSPSVSATQLGNAVSVDIVISDPDNSDIGAFDFFLNYNSDILAYESYALDNGLGNPAVGDALDLSIGKVGNGRIHLAESSELLSFDTQPDTFVLATVTFAGTGEGSSSLSLSDILFGDEQGSPLTVSANDTSVSVEKSQNSVTEIYRSVEPYRTDPVAVSDGAGQMTIIGDNAQFPVGMPPNVGVGDVLIYGEQNHAAFIHKRISPTVFVVKTDTGDIPAPIAADNSWSIYRAYTSLQDAVNGNENVGIPQPLRNSDARTDGKDLVADNQRWMIACYAGAEDTTRVYMGSWTTGPENYIKIFTPDSPEQVGISQRHNGKWSEDSYRLVTAATDDYQSSLYIMEDYVIIEGIQIYTKADNSYTYSITTNFLGSKDSNHLWVSGCILKGDNTGRGGGIMGYDWAKGNLTVRNTIVYDMAEVCISSAGQNTFEAYNNTVYNCLRGFHVSDPNFVVKNNIAANSVIYDYSNRFSSESTDNVSSDGSAAMWDMQNGITYINPEEHFADVAGRDFHLKETSFLRGRNVGALPE